MKEFNEHFKILIRIKRNFGIKNGIEKWKFYVIKILLSMLSYNFGVKVRMSMFQWSAFKSFSRFLPKRYSWHVMPILWNNLFYNKIIGLRPKK